MIGILDKILFKTPYTKNEIFRAIIGFSGVIILVEPELFYKSDIDLYKYQDYVEGWKKLICVGVYFISITIWSYSVILCRNLKNVDTISLTFNWGFFLVLYACLGQIILEPAKVPSLVELLGALIFSGLFSFMDSMLFIRASQIGKAGRSAILFCLSPVYAFAFEIFYLKEHHNPISYIGAILVVLNGLHLAFYNK